MFDVLAKDLLDQAEEPTLLVDASERIVFASRAARRLLGANLYANACRQIIYLLDAYSTDKGCCWSSLDDYIKRKTDALWVMRSADGRLVPCICKISSIEIGGKPRYIYLAITPLGSPRGARLRFFSSLMARSADRSVYENWVQGFFKGQWGVRTSWTKPSEQMAVGSRSLASQFRDARSPISIDAWSSSRQRRSLRRCFLPDIECEDLRALVINAKGPLVREMVLDACAAVCIQPEGKQKSEDIVPDHLQLASLSERERQVVQMALTGSTDREIAGRLRISVHTVKNHMRSVMSKCGVSKRIQLVPLLRGAPEQSS